MLKSINFLSSLTAWAVGSAAMDCPSWFEGLGQKWLDGLPDSPGIQMTISSKHCNLRCLGSWVSPYENYTANPPLLEYTPYMLASVTKPFTALAVLKLVEEGSVDINASVTSYLPDWAIKTLEDTMDSPEQAEQITPWMLMHHKGGLPNAPADIRFLELWSDNPSLNLSRRETFEWVAENMPAVGPPGGDWIYSDTGYAYLGELIEQVTGVSLGAAVREAARMEDLCMTSTWWIGLEDRPETALPRAGQYIHEIDITNINPSHSMYGGTGLVSNSEDMARFARAFHQGFHLGEEGMKLAYDLVPTPEDVPSVGYGCGWHLEYIVGQKAWHHRGGWGTWMYYFPDLDLSLTGALNQNSLLTTMPLIVEDVIQHVLEEGCTAE